MPGEFVALKNIQANFHGKSGNHSGKFRTEGNSFASCVSISPLVPPAGEE